ncbi:hypothetical protein NSK_000235 [Nannochloropsis salina CCMP1776]|uniref:Oxidation resistance protein 1 n=1 Tax=Nannochloropsis salina CCMP1776 TaxID=1027361 RepID=A0A4D9DBE4_9STRA|nr:hypothetical protein NSK_000235 [Nannochloropsis salina CCMP1776]|eukprot:TFJ88666.1 hypothetical protein NSK_000235 [Nannochloropsis salina CCMP1776]
MDSLHNVGGAMNFRPEQHQTDEHADGQMRIPPLPSCADASPARHLSFSSVSPRTTTTLSISSPALFAPGHQSEILNKKDVEELDSLLPTMYQGYSWNLRFSLDKDGSSFQTFYRQVKSVSPTILVIRSKENEVFGGFTTTPWAVHTTAAGPLYYGTGESFLYKVRPSHRSQGSSLSISENGIFNAEDEEEDLKRPGENEKSSTRRKMIQFFPWTRENTYYMLSTENSLGMGGGGGEFGLFIGDNFLFGSSGESETFYNAPLARHKTFEILSFECWSLEHPMICPSTLHPSSSSALTHSSSTSFSLSPPIARHGNSRSLGSDQEIFSLVSPHKSVYEIFESDSGGRERYQHGKEC